ncbi:amino acid adenylation domain-containing protein [Silvibacterium sp.]|uniref:amino acid adenylation domain-containing protein n=1 Tax=Silvibacterium sp. TaxID=1964179 RepID=UPI0039E263BA
MGSPRFTAVRPRDARAMEDAVANLWQQMLGLPEVGREDNFFDLGGTSLLATRLLSKLNQTFAVKLPASAVFEHTTVRAMASRLMETLAEGETPREEAPQAEEAKATPQSPVQDNAIAIIGMTGRFPGADSVEEFWQNLCDGVESITFFDQNEVESPIPQGESLAPYVAAKPLLRDVKGFDAGFFGIYPKEAELMDPQHRIFLECAWEVLERAGYDPVATPGAVGVFAGCSMNTYFMQNLATGREYLESFTGGYQTGGYTTMLGNDKDFLPTRISYKLNLKGPSIAVQTACSTSLVAVSQACQSLMTGGCDMALAGAVSVTFPLHRGYLPQEGGLASLDGHCRPFDAKASGTIFGHGAGVVLLKRLSDAVADGDQVLAVIRGFAINNDGAAKVGYTAPGIEGQSEVIARAQQMAGVDPETITYIEAHGTATPLGDPIEVAALTKAFRRKTDARAFCSIGTAKSNVGHLDVAAGATGLIKTVLQIENRRIPKLLHYEAPNPNLELEDSPFTIAKEDRPWAPQGIPLRAGVSAFGIGGTNAHVIVEEPPVLPATSEGRRDQLLVWSAKTPTALETMRSGLAEFFAKHPEINLADAAWTLQAGRSRFAHRAALVVSSIEDAIATLNDTSSKRVLREERKLGRPDVVFCFPGQGVQTLNMARGLYETEPVFRAALETCSSKLEPLLGERLIDVIYPAVETPEAAARLNQTERAQPAIFAVEYALAQLWLSWGIEPAAMVGHSVGEYVALCLAGSVSLDDALKMIATRSRLMQQMPHGSMLTVRAPEDRVRTLMTEALELALDMAAVNGPQLCVVSGTDEAIVAFIAKLDAAQIVHRRLITSHAFHSRMVDAALAPFAAFLTGIKFSAPQIPVISTVHGNLLTEADVADPAYWTRQLRGTVRFADAIAEAAKTPERVFLEVGPAETLVQLARQIVGSSSGNSGGHAVIASQAGLKDGVRGEAAMQSAVGRLWLAGVVPSWNKFHESERRHRTLLPTYPFERKPYWVAPIRSQSPQPQAQGPQRPASYEVGSAISAVPPEVSPMHASSASASPMLDALIALISDLSGVELAGADTSASFFELGFDSLFLTQLTQSIQQKYKVKLTFRQIMEDYSTIDALVAHLDEKTPAELKPQAAAAPVAPVVAAAPAPIAAAAAPVFAPVAAPVTSFAAPIADGSGLQALFAAQTQALSHLFQQQIAALAGAAPVASAAPAVIPAPVLPAPVAAPAPQPVAAAPAASASHATPAPVAAKVVEAEAAPQKPVFVPFKPIQRGTDQGFNPTQRAYLDKLIARYNQRTAASKEFTQAHRTSFADGRVVSGFHQQIKELIYPLVVDRAKGAYLWDKNGNRYVDILNGYGAILYGHSPDWLLEAVRNQMELGFPIGPQTELAGICSELVRELTGMERVTFCNTGSEAVMGAMRLARTVTGRNLVVVFGGDYHGSFDEVLVKAAGKRTVPIAPGIPRESVANMLVLDYGSDEALEIIRQRADEIAAVLVEPIQSRHPELRPVEFLREVRRITAQSGSALIFDEVVTGFRTHPGGLQAVFGIKADMATYGKVVAGGLPVGVLAGRAEFMNALDGGPWQYGDASFPETGVTFYAGTFMRHPMAMAAVRASLEHLKAAGPSLQESVAKKTSALVGDLRAMFTEFSLPSAIETYSSWFYLPVSTEPFLSRMLHFHLREKGLHIQEGFPCFLTTAHSEEDFDFVRQAFRASLEEMREGQALPNSAPTSSPAAVADGSSSTTHAVAAHAVLSPSSPLSSAEPATDIQIVPITEEQREILLGTQLGNEANCAFNESTSLVLKGGLNVDAFAAALGDLVQRHESLRLHIDMATEKAVIEPNVELPLLEEDLSSQAAAEQARTLAELIRQEASTPFDLSEGPLFRARLVKLHDSEYRFVLTAHHIVFDGWSTNVFYNELSELYNARLTGRAHTLAPALRFTEYARRNAAQNTAEAFWLSQFETVPSALQLPTDRPRSALRTNRGASKRFVIPTELAAGVRKAGAKQGSTLFATLLASTALLVHRLTEQDDIVLGIPMAGQSKAENGGTLIAHGVNFLPIRSRFTADQPFAQFVKKTRSTLLDAYDHQDYTYGTLLRRLKIPSDPSRLPLIEFQVNVEQVGAQLAFDGLHVDVFGNPKAFVNMDVFFNFVDRGGEIWLECDYNTDLFDETTIARWFGHLEAILGAFIADPAKPSTEIPLLTAEQSHQILVEWNRTATEYPRHASIHRLFELQAEKTPNATAVVSDQHSFTYAELNEKANQVANFLRRSGVKPGTRVAMSLPRSPEVIVSLLAVLKTGAAFVPVDPSHPAARLKFLIEDSSAPVLLTNRATAAKLPELGVNLIQLDADWAAIALEETSNLAYEGSADDLAYVMYTSGSTGNPKGVLVPQRAVTRLVLNNHFASFGADEVFLQLAPLSFDASTFEIWGALLNGAKLVIAIGERVTPEDIGRLIAANGVTTLWLTAALFHLVATEYLEILRPLRQLLAGGDSLSLTHVRRVLTELPHLKLINGYGPTENTTFTCCHPISLESTAQGNVPIGRPINNTRVYIVDSRLNPVPVGVVGELYAAGDGLAQGYLNAPEQTAAKFVEHTFAGGVTERLYRTGDLARYRPDGTIEFFGRADTQVKIRGYRIELGEIEYALEQSPSVRSAVVAVRTDWVSPHDLPGDKRLVAYVIPTESIPAGSSEAAELTQQLRLRLEEQLPDYMRPAAIMLLESFPRTLNGKVDRRALPAPVAEQMLRRKAIVAPRNAQEETLAGIWQKALGLDQVSVEDSVFEVGGDSLLIFRMTTMANQSGLAVTARDFFQYKTIAAICEHLPTSELQETGAEAGAKKAGGIQAIPRAQRRQKLTSLQ